MKSIKLYTSAIICMLLAVTLLVSCTKTFDEKIALQTDFTNSSTLQIYNTMVNSARNYLFVDGKIINGGAPMTPGTLFPATGSDFSIASGDRVFLVRDTLTATTQLPLSFAQNLRAAKNYTLFMYDTINSPKQKIVETNIVIPSDTTARLRFANFAYSPNAIVPVDVFSKRLNKNIFTNVAITDVTGFIPYDTRRADTLIIRETGVLTDLQNRTVTTSGTPPVTVTTFSPVQIIFSLASVRSYTVIFRGSYRTDLTTAATVRSLSLFTNN